MTCHMSDALGKLGLLAAHVDTRDPRPIATIGRLDLQNVALAFSHLRSLNRALARHRDAAVLLPLSQGTMGLMRDALFIALTRVRGRQVVLHLHGGGLAQVYDQASAPLRWLLRWVCGQADRAWALTPGLQAMFDGLVGRDRVAYLENVVAAPSPEAAARTSSITSDPSRRFTVLYLSNLLREKGALDLIEAVAQLGLAAAPWEVRIVGGGSASVIRELQSKIDSLPQSGPRFDLVPGLYGEDKWRAFQEADVVAFPTYYPPEGQPLALLEAMAAGVPIVSTYHGGIPETVRHGIEGLLVAPRDIDGLAEALQRLAADADLRLRLSRAGRTRYRERYAPDRLIRDLPQLLAPLLADPAEPARSAFPTTPSAHVHSG